MITYKYYFVCLVLKHLQLELSGEGRTSPASRKAWGSMAVAIIASIAPPARPMRIPLTTVREAPWVRGFTRKAPTRARMPVTTKTENLLPAR